MSNYLTSPTCWTLILGSLLATLLLTPLAIRLARRLGAIDRGGYRKINGRAIPRMGGLAIALPFLALAALGAFYHPTLMFALLNGREADFLPLLLGGAAVLALGIVDDLYGLGARWKFLVQGAVALGVAFAGKGISSMELPLLGQIHFGAASGAALTVLWIVGVMNAFNLVDGVDGLATGLGLIAALGLGLIAALNGNTFSVLLCLGLSGSLAGFLVFNFHPARVFLGDTGSLFIGFALAMLSLMGAKAAGSILMAGPALALGFPLFDTLTSMARRLLRGRSPFVGDRAHTHHRLLDYGYSQRQVTLILYAVSLLCAVSAALCQVYYPNDKKPLLAVGLDVLVIGALAWANGYLRLRHIVRIVSCRARNSKLAGFQRYAGLILRGQSRALGLAELLRLGCRELNLNYLELVLEETEEVLAGHYEHELRQSGVAERLRVRTAEGQVLLVLYQVNLEPHRLHSPNKNIAEAAKLECQDIMACLANLFTGLNLARLAALPAAAPRRHSALIQEIAPRPAATLHAEAADC